MILQERGARLLLIDNNLLVAVCSGPKCAAQVLGRTDYLNQGGHASMLGSDSMTGRIAASILVSLGLEEVPPTSSPKLPPTCHALEHVFRFHRMWRRTLVVNLYVSSLQGETLGVLSRRSKLYIRI